MITIAGGIVLAVLALILLQSEAFWIGLLILAGGFLIYVLAWEAPAVLPILFAIGIMTVLRIWYLRRT